MDRAARSLLCTVAAAMLLASCTVQVPMSPSSLRVEDSVRVESGTAFRFVRTDGQECGVYRLRGRVAGVRGDTVMLVAVTQVAASAAAAVACTTPADGAFVVSDLGPTVIATRRDEKQETNLSIALVVIAVAVVIAIEHFTPDWPN